MLSVYKYLDYRLWAQHQAQLWKKSAAHRTLQVLADRVGVQPPYLTNFLKQKVHLSADQLFRLCKVFGLEEDEQGYVFLLMERERSGLEDRRQALKAQIERIRKQKLQSEAHLKAKKVEVSVQTQAGLFLKPEVYVIYFFLGIEKYAKDLSRIASALNLSMAQIDSTVKELVEMGYLEVKRGRLIKTSQHFHLSKESPLCGPHQNLLRYQCLHHQQKLAADDKYNFTVTFTADPQTRESIQQEFLKFLEGVEAQVKAAPSEEVYQMNFDLFAWSATG